MFLLQNEKKNIFTIPNQREKVFRATYFRSVSDEAVGGDGRGAG